MIAIGKPIILIINIKMTIGSNIIVHNQYRKLFPVLSFKISAVLSKTFSIKKKINDENIKIAIILKIVYIHITHLASSFISCID
jgi:hypothetical protein|tara:strand:+ start:287 stop:538 length:252 start_codon:yes stop_codon:yes gene_type:complete